MNTENQTKCIHCGSTKSYILLGNPDSNRFAYFCSNCRTSWNNSDSM